MTSACSVVSVTYHTGPVLFIAIQRALAQPGLAELIIVDNGNPPNVLTRLQQWALSEPRLKIISGQGNVGFARGCNLGVRAATGEFVLLLNPDCLLPPDALPLTMSALQNMSGAMLAGCWLQNPDGSEQRGGRRQLLTPTTALSEALGLHMLLRLKRLNNYGLPMPAIAHEVPAVSGAYMCMRKSDYTRLGGMDEGFFLHVEDLDLCMRVHKAGGKIICVPGVQVAHMLSTSGEVSSRFIEWQKAKGFMRYFHKHFGNQPLVWLADAGIWLRYAVKVLLGLLRRKRQSSGHSLASKRLMILAFGELDLPRTQALQDKSILVTGATSPLGLCVIRRLLAAGASVLALSRDASVPFHHAQLRWLKGDLTDPALSLQNYLADIAVHCAPLWHLPRIIGLLADAEVKRLVAFGSTSIFGKAASHNYYEKKLVLDLARAEQDIATRAGEKNIAWTLLRPTLIYGLGLDSNVASLARVIKRFGFFPVYPPAFGKRQPVHADDLALAVLQAIANTASYNKAYNVSGGEIIAYRQMLERIFVLYRKPVRIVETTLLPFALDVAGRLLRKRDLNGEIARRMNDDLIFFHDDATRDFGYAPRSFLSGGIHDAEGF